jgi:hypothetical protein
LLQLTNYAASINNSNAFRFNPKVFMFSLGH